MAAIAEAPRIAFPDVESISVWQRWRYQGGKRDVRLDFLRGFAAFAMVVDHVSGARSWLYLITGGDVFYASAAEAFVFISGLVMGMVYRGVIEREGIGAAVTKALRRAWTLYVLTVFLTFSFAAMSALLDLPWALHMALRDLPQFIIGTLTLHQTYHLADVLLMYTFFVAAAGPVLALFARGKVRWVLAGSWTLWLVWQIWPNQAQVPWTIDRNDVFQLAAWQALFVTALAVGYYRRTLEQRLARLSAGTILAAGAALLMAAAILYFGALGSAEVNGSLAARMFAKPDLRLGRVVVFAGAFSFAFALCTIAWLPLQRVFGWLLLPLGHYALSVYALHIFVVGALWKWLPVAGRVRGSEMLNSLIQLAAVAIVWGAIVLWPEMAGIADCCIHCRRASDLKGMLLHERTHASPDRMAWDKGGRAQAAGPNWTDAHRGVAACEHPEPHEACP